jgi:hypothetical protein
MDEDGNAPDRLGLPKSLAESNDPVDGNPYTAAHPAHRVWLAATRRAEAEICRLNADAHVSLTAETAIEWMPTLVAAKFDVWAERGVKVVWTDQAEREYAAWLVDYANAWIESMDRFFASHPPPFPHGVILAELRRRLGARGQHWRAEALRYRVQQEVRAATAGRVQPRPSAALVKRRWDVIRKHRDAHRLDAVGFARRVGVSETAIKGIVRGDRTRFDDDTEDRRLKAIRMTREEWYRE